jgi:hypothetical protein
MVKSFNMTKPIHFQRRPWLIMILFLFGISACAVQPSSDIPTTAAPFSTPTAAITATPLPSVTATLGVDQVSLTATYYAADPVVPILTYHHFKNDNPEDVSDSMKVKYSDFREQLQSLYDAGYTLVPLETWLRGDLSLEAGRRPLVLSLDDLYFADQLYLNEDGTPSNRSGLGILWEFYQEHPDFGYSAALFYNLGDKLYGNHMTTTWFIVTDGWEEALAKVIVWGIEHDLMPYNHFYTHPQLAKLDGPTMLYEFQQNEIRMKQLLTMAGRPELFNVLDNMIALTYGAWPGTEYMNEFLVGMPSQTRKPLLAVFEIDYAIRAKYMLPPYAPGFDRFHIPRLVANAESVELLVEQKDQFPQAQQCTLGTVHITEAEDTEIIKNLLLAATEGGGCTGAIHVVNGRLFRVVDGVVTEVTVPAP